MKLEIATEPECWTMHRRRAGGNVLSLSVYIYTNALSIYSIPGYSGRQFFVKSFCVEALLSEQLSVLFFPLSAFDYDDLKFLNILTFLENILKLSITSNTKNFKT